MSPESGELLLLLCRESVKLLGVVHQQVVPPEHQDGDGGGGGDRVPVHVQDEDNVILLSTKGEQLQHGDPTLSGPVRAVENLFKN